MASSSMSPWANLPMASKRGTPEEELMALLQAQGSQQPQAAPPVAQPAKPQAAPPVIPKVRKVAQAPAVPAAPQPPADGLLRGYGISSKQQDQEETQDKSGTTNKSDTYLDYPQSIRLQLQARGLNPDQANSEDYASPILAMEDEAKAYQDALAQAEQQPLRPDLSPLAQLAEYETKGRYKADNYKRPETAEERRNKLLDFKTKIIQQQGNIAKALNEAVKAQKTGSQTDLFQKLQIQKLLDEQGYTDPRLRSSGSTDQEIRWGNTIQDKLMHDPVLKAAELQIAGTAEARSLLNRGTSVNDEAFKTKVARALGDAPLSNVDIARKSGGKDVADRLEQMITTIMSGTFSDENRANFKQMLDDLDWVNKQRAKAQRHYWEVQAQNTYKFNPEKAKSIVQGGLDQRDFQVPDNTPQATPGKKSVDMVRIMKSDGTIITGPRAKLKEALAKYPGSKEVK
jgi:hypothetical protein